MTNPPAGPRERLYWTPAEIEAEVRNIERARSIDPRALIGDYVGFDGRPDLYDPIRHESMDAYYRQRYGPGYARWLRSDVHPSWRFWRWLARWEAGRLMGAFAAAP